MGDIISKSEHIIFKNIEFYFMPEEMIPTDLILRVDYKTNGIVKTMITVYEKINQYNYNFYMHGIEIQEAYQIIRHIAEIMCEQKEDTGTPIKVDQVDIINSSFDNCKISVRFSHIW